MANTIQELFDLKGKIALITGCRSLGFDAGIALVELGATVALAPYGIYVNCISPGGFSRNQPNQFIKNYESRVPLGRMGEDGVDIKGAVAFLASSASNYVVGHNLVVDGGWTAW